jgi:hypothetical protein
MMAKSQMWGMGEHPTRHKQHHNTPRATNEGLSDSLLHYSLNKFLAAISVHVLANNIALATITQPVFVLLHEKCSL